MTSPEFQVFQCTNNLCRLRFSTDLTTKNLSNCPKCGSKMTSVGSPYSNYINLAKHANPKKMNLVLVLDNLRSTLNVGSIFRTADGAGVSHIYCCGTTPTPDHPKIRKTSLGAESLTAWSYHPNCFDLITHLKNKIHSILSLEQTARSISLFDYLHLNNYEDLALVVGNEISGIDPEIIQLSDAILSIPMHGQKTSLNVAVSAGIAMYFLSLIQINSKSEKG